MNIIVIDDELSALHTFLHNILGNSIVKSYKFFDNAKETLEYCQQNCVNIAFVDINMPDLNGIELAKKMVEINKDTLLVFISGYAHDKKKIMATFKDNFIAFCEKPYDKAELEDILVGIQSRLQQKLITIKTFGCFDIFIGDTIMDFPRKKSKELLALLVDNGVGCATMDYLVGNLWPEKPLALAKRLYRDAVSRLKLVLAKYSILHICEFRRAEIVMHSDNINCDIWEYLKGNIPRGDQPYMLNYDWAIDKYNC